MGRRLRPYVASSETRAKMSRAQRGNTNKRGTRLSLLSRMRISQSQIGRHIPASVRETMAIAQIKRRSDPRDRAKTAAGVRASYATDPSIKLKHSESLKRHHQSDAGEAHRIKLGETLARYYAEHPEARQSISAKVRAHWEQNKDSQARAILLGLRRRPTRPEQTIIDIIEKHNLPYKYVGNGKIIINGRCPDFINTNGKKLLIEVFGDYWHTVGGMEGEEPRQRAFKEYGFDTLILWESDIKTLTEDTLLEVVQKFTLGHAVDRTANRRRSYG